MIPAYRRTLAKVRASYTPEKAADEKRHEPLAGWVYRPLSFPVTPLFLAAGFSADGVTVLAILAALAMPLLALGCGAASWPAIVALALGIQVLDCVDGNLARTTGRSSAIGGMLDSLATLIFWAAYFGTVGFLAHAEGAGWIGRHGRELGLALTALFLAQRQIEDTHAQYLAERVRFAPSAPAGASATLEVGGIAKIVEHLAAFGGLAVAGVVGALGVFFAICAAYQVTATVWWFARFVRRVQAQRAASLNRA